MKTCSKCKTEKPFEAFSKYKREKDGYNYICKECDKLRRKELKKSPLMQLENQIRSSIRLENKLLAREGKKLCAKCKEVFLIDDLKGNYCEICMVERNSEYNRKNKERINEKQRDWNKKNIEKKKEYDRERSRKNKDKISEYQREYREKKKLEKEN